MKMHILLSLFHLPIRHTKGKYPLIVYSQSHVVTNFKYLDILRRKAVEKAIAKEIKEGKQKKKEEK